MGPFPRLVGDPETDEVVVCREPKIKEGRISLTFRQLVF